MRKFVAVDLETGGLNPELFPIIEVGLVIEEDNHNYREIEFSLDFDPGCCSLKALEVNRWGQREFPPVLPRNEAIELLSEELRGVHIVGKNPQFDVGFLRVAFEDFDLTPTWHHRLVDVGSLVWGWSVANGGLRRQPPNVAHAAEMTGVEWLGEEQHTALGDARLAMKMFRKCIPYDI